MVALAASERAQEKPPFQGSQMPQGAGQYLLRMQYVGWSL